MTTRLNLIDRIILLIAGRFGEKGKEVERFLKFATVGAMGAVVDFTVLNLLQSTVLPPIDPNHNLKIALASGIAFYTAVTSNFIWNRYWTYPDSRSRSARRQLAQFAFVSSGGAIFRILFVSTTFHAFGVAGVDVLEALSLVSEVSTEAINRLGTNIAQGIAIVIVMFWNFFINRYWTFNDVDRD